MGKGKHLHVTNECFINYMYRQIFLGNVAYELARWEENIKL